MDALSRQSMRVAGPEIVGLGPARKAIDELRALSVPHGAVHAGVRQGTADEGQPVLSQSVHRAHP